MNRRHLVALAALAAQGGVDQVLDGGRFGPAMRFVEVHRQAAPVAVGAEGRTQCADAHRLAYSRISWPISVQSLPAT